MAQIGERKKGKWKMIQLNKAIIADRQGRKYPWGHSKGESWLRNCNTTKNDDKEGMKWREPEWAF